MEEKNRRPPPTPRTNRVRSSTLVVDPFQRGATVAECRRCVRRRAREKNCNPTMCNTSGIPRAPRRAQPLMHRWHDTKIVKVGQKPPSARRRISSGSAPRVRRRRGRCPFRCPSRRCSATTRRRASRPGAAIAAPAPRLAASAPRAPRPRAVAVAVAQPQPDPPRGAADDGLGRGRRARLRAELRRRRCATCGASRAARRAGIEYASRIIFARRAAGARTAGLDRARAARGPAGPARRAAGGSRALSLCSSRMTRARRRTVLNRLARPTTSPSPRVGADGVRSSRTRRGPVRGRALGPVRPAHHARDQRPASNFSASFACRVGYMTSTACRSRTGCRASRRDAPAGWSRGAPVSASVPPTPSTRDHRAPVDGAKRARGTSCSAR